MSLASIDHSPEGYAARVRQHNAPMLGAELPLEIVSHGDLWNGITLAIMREQQTVLERHIMAVIQPKPRWVPTWLWHRVIHRVLLLQEHR